MQNIHGKEIDLLRTTVKVPGKRLPRATPATAPGTSPRANGLASERSNTQLGGGTGEGAPEVGGGHMESVAFFPGTVGTAATRPREGVWGGALRLGPAGSKPSSPLACASAAQPNTLAKMLPPWLWGAAANAQPRW